MIYKKEIKTDYATEYNDYWKNLYSTEKEFKDMVEKISYYENPSDGVYISNLWFAGHIIGIIESHEQPKLDYYDLKYESIEYILSLSPYGVCDNYQQVLDKFPILETTDKNIIITMAPICKEGEPSKDGWRWEKWGEYIGTQKSNADYLYDESEIEMVYVYQIHEISNNIKESN